MFRRVVAPAVEIRVLQESDAEEMFSVVDRNRAHLREWLPWVDRTKSSEDLRAFVRGKWPDYEAGRELHAAIWVEGWIAGAIGHHAIDAEHRATSLGYWIDQAQQGRGTITHCCHSMLDYLFDERELHRVEIRCGTANARSCAVPKRLGFTLEGVLRHAQRVNDRWIDLVVWGMLEHEWRK
jgi:ribosomal-protein-serine acetyltransferase